MLSGEGHQNVAVTEFLSAETESTETVCRQHVHFMESGLLERMIDAIPNVLMVLNDKRQLVFANQPFLDIVDAKGGDSVLGARPGELLRCIHAESSELGCGTTKFCKTCGAARAIQKSLSGKRDEQECRITVNRDSGTDSLDLLVTTVPLTLDGDRYTVFHIQDISDRKRRRALERIFFHDVINTAGAIRGFLELIDTDSLGEDGEYLSIVREQTNRLVRDILAQKQLQDAENGELEVCVGSIDGGELLRALVGMYARHPAGEGRTLVVDEESRRVEFESDPSLVSRVIENMIKNALEATPLGGVVRARCDQEDGRVVFEVHNPREIPEATRLQMFKRSFSTKGIGRGLGTYSMQLLASRYLGGEVRFESTLASGTSFFLSLPLGKEENP